MKLAPKQLQQAGALNNQVLSWDSTAAKWLPKSIMLKYMERQG